ncbi:branched-chain amino acid ABC transporter permease [Limnohabitans sp. 15K]|jgi:branched-chain amino acid transport system permease protein|uniref:branched-chain amino acid ABC transporter permease n=1 Tax=Limnohabitans sp. 15K TaxID=1100706 RepID=UPI000C1E6B89|nr:branched-chain amino acid ABC transporter permease [Limnohabitans sp. 15K]PIT79641.1 branched-chain amino acid ABC transporter permease [Limnohabitans sp. 15K]
MKRVLPYLVLIALAALIYFVFPDQLPLAARIAIMAIFVMSLDMVVGYGGLATLGHSALFGIGAYASGILAMHFTGNPLIGLLVGSLAGALVALLSGLFLLRFEGLTFLMLTVAIGQIAQNGASKLRNWTGGEDGLSGFEIQKLFGVWSFDLYGKVAFVYCFVMMLICLWAMRRIMGSPFGLSVVGIHQNRLRTAAIGGSVRGQLLKLYTLAGLFAGIGGALNAQVNQIVGLDTLGFELSAEALVMLVLGGAGNLYGAIGGTAAFMLIHHTASSINPYHWLFIIGGLLVFVVLVPRARLLGALRERVSRLLPVQRDLA